ncbi:hypothetical protein LCGC14_0398990 [marine sediment metagenome]|uniref:Uncharacterized protein n=1 Tax=marine sediment metagenome TaxID=412755 RepID=A0A0F9W6A9_9ZZZZ
MPWLQSDVNVGYRIHIIEEDRKPLEKLLAQATEYNSPRIIYHQQRKFSTETIVATTKEVHRVLKEMAEEEEWAQKQKMAREAEEIL